MASFITRRTSSGSPPNRSRESSRSRESCRSRESSVEPVARTPPNPRASGSVLSECFADVTLLKASWRSFELFKYLEEETMNMCINKMKLRTFNAGDKIIKKGSIGISMFFIDLGTARAEIRGHTAQTLKSGDYFGELAFVATCKKFLRDKDDTSAPEQAVRAADVVATSTCRIFQLSVKDFITILQSNHSGSNSKVLSALRDTCNDRKATIQRLEKSFGTHKAKARNAWDSLSMMD
jgi:CRP-like cAMP-binding protein